MRDMKQKIENILAVIFLILLALLLSMVLTAECGSIMDPVRRQIKEESMIF